MQVIHFYHSGDTAAQAYAQALADGMDGEAVSELCCHLPPLRKLLSKGGTDIVNIHGCWHTALALAQVMTERAGARVVITPHGQLEPWIMRQRYWTDKMPRLMAFQQRCLSRAFAIVAMGRMEAANLKRMISHSRVETVLNSLITDTISQQDMATQVFNVYQKVLNTDVAALMEQDTIMAFRAIVKAALTGDERWLSDDERMALSRLSHTERHKLLVFACQEGLNPVVAQGVATLRLSHFEQLYASVESYNKAPSNAPGARGIVPPAESEPAIAQYVKDTQRMARQRKLTFAHLVALASTLRRADIDEERLAERMAEKRLTRHAQRIMHVLAEYTGLEEGLMPLAPRHDRATDKLMTTITKHLRT